MYNLGEAFDTGLHEDLVEPKKQLARTTEKASTLSELDKDACADVKKSI